MYVCVIWCSNVCEIAPHGRRFDTVCFFSLARPLPISICAMVMRNGPTGNNESPYVSILCIFI